MIGCELSQLLSTFDPFIAHLWYLIINSDCMMKEKNDKLGQDAENGYMYIKTRNISPVFQTIKSLGVFLYCSMFTLTRKVFGERENCTQHDSSRLDSAKQSKDDEEFCETSSVFSLNLHFLQASMILHDTGD